MCILKNLYQFPLFYSDFWPRKGFKTYCLIRDMEIYQITSALDLEPFADAVVGVVEREGEAYHAIRDPKQVSRGPEYSRHIIDVMQDSRRVASLRRVLADHPIRFETDDFEYRYEMATHDWILEGLREREIILKALHYLEDMELPESTQELLMDI